jgi:hypothetical protein
MKSFWCVVIVAMLCGHTAVLAQERIPGVEYKLPAPGCPKEYPTGSGVETYCSKLDGDACRASSHCKWLPAKKGSDGAPDLLAQCDAKVGQSIRAEVSLYLFKGPVRFTEDEPQGVTDLGARAVAAAASKRYDDALRVYAQALIALGEKHTNSQTMFRVRRGNLFELKRDKARAINEYCESLVYATNAQAEDFARKRVFQLTQASGADLALPVFQKAGVIQMTQGRPLAPFTIKLPAGSPDYAIRLRDVRSNREDMLFYVPSGTTVKVTVPLGSYRVSAARGTVWFGTDLLFGVDTQYFRLKKRDGEENYVFVNQGGRLIGWTIDFKLVQHGNVTMPSIPADEF